MSMQDDDFSPEDTGEEIKNAAKNAAGGVKKAARAAKNTAAFLKNAADAVSRIISAIGSLIVNPVAWIVAGVVLLFIVVFVAVSTVGPADSVVNGNVERMDEAIRREAVALGQRREDGSVDYTAVKDDRGNPLLNENGDAVYTMDAGSFLYALDRYGEYLTDDEDLYLMDTATLKMILRKVDEYNREMREVREVRYEYVEETGSFTKDYDEVTGEDYGKELYEIWHMVRKRGIRKKVTPSPSPSASPAPSGSPLPDRHRGADGFEHFDEIEAKKDGFFLLDEKCPSDYDFALCGEGYEYYYYYVRELVPQENETKEDTVMLGRNGMDEGITGDTSGYGVGYLRWQPVFALCSAYVQMYFDNAEDENPGEESRFLTEEEADRILDVFRYDFTFAADRAFGAGEKLSAGFYESVGYGYRLSVEFSSLLTAGQKKTIKRIPVLLPYRISNSFVTIEYNYEPVVGKGGKEGYYELKSRTRTTDKSGFARQVKELVGEADFESTIFLDILGVLPYSDDLVKLYEGIAETGEGKTVETTVSREECPLIGSYVKLAGLPGNGLIDPGRIAPDGDGYLIPLYPADSIGGKSAHLRPGEWIVPEDGQYGEWWVSVDAFKTLDASDGYTADEIYRYLHDVTAARSKAGNPLFASDAVIREFARCLHDLQENYGVSVAGLLGINQQEGGFNASAIAKNYNYFNDTNGTWRVPGYERFTSFRLMIENGEIERRYGYDAVSAYYYSAGNIYRRYIGRAKYQKDRYPQDTYFSMCFRGYGVDSPATAYDTLTHCFCPPYDDNAMPYSRDSSVGGNRLWKNSGENHHGWVNNCTAYRNEMYAYLGAPDWYHPGEGNGPQ